MPPRALLPRRRSPGTCGLRSPRAPPGAPSSATPSTWPWPLPRWRTPTRPPARPSPSSSCTPTGPRCGLPPGRGGPVRRPPVTSLASPPRAAAPAPPRPAGPASPSPHAPSAPPTRGSVRSRGGRPPTPTPLGPPRRPRHRHRRVRLLPPRRLLRPDAGRGHSRRDRPTSPQDLSASVVRATSVTSDVVTTPDVSLGVPSAEAARRTGRRTSTAKVRRAGDADAVPEEIRGWRGTSQVTPTGQRPRRRPTDDARPPTLRRPSGPAEPAEPAEPATGGLVPRAAGRSGSRRSAGHRAGSHAGRSCSRRA